MYDVCSMMAKANSMTRHNTQHTTTVRTNMMMQMLMTVDGQDGGGCVVIDDIC